MEGFFLKNNKNWYMMLADFKVPNKIQPVMIWQAVNRWLHVRGRRCFVRSTWTGM